MREVRCFTAAPRSSPQAARLVGAEDQLVRRPGAAGGRRPAQRSCDVTQRVGRPPAAAAGRREEEGQPAQPQEVRRRPVAHGEVTHHGHVTQEVIQISFRIRLINIEHQPALVFFLSLYFTFLSVFCCCSVMDAVGGAPLFVQPRWLNHLVLLLLFSLIKPEIKTCHFLCSWKELPDTERLEKTVESSRYQLNQSYISRHADTQSQNRYSLVKKKNVADLFHV